MVLHDEHRMIFEDRLRAMLQVLAVFQPTVVVACLGTSTYEVLRYVPHGVHRMAVVQTDHPIFYEAVNPYAGCLDAVVGVSGRIAERLAAMDAFSNVAKLSLAHGVSVPQTVEPRGKAGQPLRILYLGRITDPQKRVNLFPQILTLLQRAGIPFRWTIAGQGDKRAELERIMLTSSTQEVKFIGAVPNAEVPALLEKQDIFLLTSDAEGLPMSLLEAMGHGLVPVVSDLESGIREVVNAGNGTLVPVDDVEGYARAIIHLHEHRDELAAKSAAAHELVQREFSVAAMTERWLSVLPKTVPPISEWPSRWRIRPPLAARSSLRFSLPARVLRRLFIKFRD